MKICLARTQTIRISFSVTSSVLCHGFTDTSVEINWSMLSSPKLDDEFLRRIILEEEFRLVARQKEEEKQDDEVWKVAVTAD